MVSRLVHRAFAVFALAAAPAISLDFRVSFDPEVRAEPIGGRLLLILSTDGEEEPRFQIGWDMTRTMQLFGADVEGLATCSPRRARSGSIRPRPSRSRSGSTR